MSSMLCPVLIGRGPELHALTVALDRAGDGHGSMVFLAGDPGVGKSRLAREISALAAERGFDVLSSRAVESTAPAPFRPITEALMKLARAGTVPDAAEI